MKKIILILLLSPLFCKAQAISGTRQYKRFKHFYYADTVKFHGKYTIVIIGKRIYKLKNTAVHINRVSVVEYHDMDIEDTLRLKTSNSLNKK